MILVDTSIWVDHLRRTNGDLVEWLGANQVLGHPWVIGELALGQMANRVEVLGLLSRLPQATVASTSELLLFIEREALAGPGIGYVDAQLLASARLTSGSRLTTADKRLAAAAERLGVG